MRSLQNDRTSNINHTKITQKRKQMNNIETDTTNNTHITENYTKITHKQENDTIMHE